MAHPLGISKARPVLTTARPHCAVTASRAYRSNAAACSVPQVGTIDSDYRGEVKVLLTTSDTEQDITVKKGDRIAQAIVIPVPKVSFEEVTELSNTLRGAQGFGHTG